MPSYTTEEINRLAKETDDWRWWSLNPSLSFDKGGIALQRFLLIGGPPSNSKASTLVSAVPAMARVITVDCDEAYLLGVTLQPCDEGQSLADVNGNDFSAPAGAYMCDVIFQSLSENYFIFHEQDTEKAAREALSSWGGGYATSVKMLGFLLTSKAKGSTLAALQFWGQQPPLFYGRLGQDPTPQRAYTDGVRKGTIGTGFSQGLADFPGRMVPFSWSTSLAPPGPDPIDPEGGIPMPPPGSGGNSLLAPGASSNTQNLVILGAGAAVGYVIYQRIYGGRR